MTPNKALFRKRQINKHAIAEHVKRNRDGTKNTHVKSMKSHAISLCQFGLIWMEKEFFFCGFK